MNGNVKEYDDKGKLIFEGEFKDDKRWKGRADDEKFKGEYLNGKKWNGKAEEYVYEELHGRDLTRIVTFKGEYNNGEKKGRGREFINGKLCTVTYHKGIPD